MIRYIKSKLRSKKWLNASLLLGIILFVSVVACYPMFSAGSRNKLLETAFYEQIENDNVYPAIIQREGSYKLDTGRNLREYQEQVEAAAEKVRARLGIKGKQTQSIYKLNGTVANASYGAENLYFDVAYMPEMEAHINIVKGTSLQEAQTVDGVIPCLLTTKQMDDYELTCGEILEFKNVGGRFDRTLKLQIIGIFEEGDVHDIFWSRRVTEMEKMLFVSQDDFCELMQREDFTELAFYQAQMLDYQQITYKNAMHIHNVLQQEIKQDKLLSSNFDGIMSAYKKDAATVSVLLWVLSLPMLLLLLSFIYMVSGQILQTETDEIAMMKSRGISRLEIIWLYVEQFSILSAVGLVVGIPLGLLLCKLAACTESFLVFGWKDTGGYRFVGSTVIYSLVAALVGILCMIIPVIGYSRLSIVQQKSQDKKQKQTQFWEKYYVDLILLGISVYLFYNYNRQQDVISLNMLKGEPLDPMIFINVSLFMLAWGLFMLRLIHWIVTLIYKMGGNRWSPALYASFLQITRTFAKQGFISIFLVMTIAMGIFNSNMVRSINENAAQRVAYNVGADLVYGEHWISKTYRPERGVVISMYEEPDYQRYAGLKEQGICESMTRVIEDDKAQVKIHGKQVDRVKLQAIWTKEFGETADMQDGLNDTHWYNTLNTLAKVTNGVVISKNLAEEYSLKKDDMIYVKDSSLTVVAIVDAWPGYQNTGYMTEEGAFAEKQQYLMVCNYAYAITAFGQQPYYIYMKLAKGHSADEVRDYVDAKNMQIEKFESKTQKLEDMKSSPIMQITNGMYTLSFMIAIVLCLTGFLLYWITSIRQRELMFGIYRAMGMSMREINAMLVNEQIFSSVLAVAGGAGVGVSATILFVKIVALVYLPQRHNIPITVYSNMWDMIRLAGVVVIMFAVCLIVLRLLLKNMKIAQALKLGED